MGDATTASKNSSSSSIFSAARTDGDGEMGMSRGGDARGGERRGGDRFGERAAVAPAWTECGVDGVGYRAACVRSPVKRAHMPY